MLKRDNKDLHFLPSYDSRNNTKEQKDTRNLTDVVPTEELNSIIYSEQDDVKKEFILKNINFSQKKTHEYQNLQKQLTCNIQKTYDIVKQGSEMRKKMDYKSIDHLRKQTELRSKQMVTQTPFQPQYYQNDYGNSSIFPKTAESNRMKSIQISHRTMSNERLMRKVIKSKRGLFPQNDNEGSYSQLSSFSVLKPQNTIIESNIFEKISQKNIVETQRASSQHEGNSTRQESQERERQNSPIFRQESQPSVTINYPNRTIQESCELIIQNKTGVSFGINANRSEKNSQKQSIQQSQTSMSFYKMSAIQSGKRIQSPPKFDKKAQKKTFYEPIDEIPENQYKNFIKSKAFLFENLDQKQNYKKKRTKSYLPPVNYLSKQKYLIALNNCEIKKEKKPIEENLDVTDVLLRSFKNFEKLSLDQKIEDILRKTNPNAYKRAYLSQNRFSSVDQTNDTSRYIEKNIEIYQQNLKMNEVMHKLNSKSEFRLVKNLSELSPYQNKKIHDTTHERHKSQYQNLPQIINDQSLAFHQQIEQNVLPKSNSLQNLSGYHQKLSSIVQETKLLNESLKNITDPLNIEDKLKLKSQISQISTHKEHFKPKIIPEANGITSRSVIKLEKRNNSQITYSQNSVSSGQYTPYNPKPPLKVDNQTSVSVSRSFGNPYEFNPVHPIPENRVVIIKSMSKNTSEKDISPSGAVDSPLRSSTAQVANRACGQTPSTATLNAGAQIIFPKKVSIDTHSTIKHLSELELSTGRQSQNDMTYTIVLQDILRQSPKLQSQEIVIKNENPTAYMSFQTFRDILKQQ